MSTRAGKRAVQREKAATEEPTQGLLEIRGVSPDQTGERGMTTHRGIDVKRREGSEMTSTIT